jgi:hypothetical protein
METILKFVGEHFFQIVAIGVLWNVVGMGWLLWKRHKKGIRMPNPRDADVVFLERFASGSSHKSFITRMGGARNCLTIIVTKTDFCITTFFPFTAFAGMYDLEHIVPLGKILKVQERGRIVEVHFLNPSGLPAKVSLRLRRTDEFTRAIQRSPTSEAVAPNRSLPSSQKSPSSVRGSED